MTPYLQLLHAIVDRLRAEDPFATPPAVLVMPEADEPDPERPGQGDSLSDAVEAALAKVGVAVVVYIEDVEITDDGCDRVGVRVQVIEHTVNNRHERGSQKPNLTLAHFARSLLENWQSAERPEWTPLLFEGLDTITKGIVLIRELRFTTFTRMSSV